MEGHITENMFTCACACTSCSPFGWVGGCGVCVGEGGGYNYMCLVPCDCCVSCTPFVCVLCVYGGGGGGLHVACACTTCQPCTTHPHLWQSAVIFPG